ncbi:hypothetical protein H5410_060072 [Solanum commersonii]|uniref:Uncharacterized protein n=1 Tax=Solanum commersonii TaxID=4109 RepID=A0A9J5W478_SOLCO|nr:hypothetical protein H5410_060072 [Solanum commersonii]
MHKELKLIFMNNTEVVEDKSQFKTEQFSNGFISFDEAEKITNGSLFVKTLTGRSIRHEVIVTNERYDRKVMILWGDFAEIEGQVSQSLESDKPVLAFRDLSFKKHKRITELITPAKIGDFVLSTTLRLPTCYNINVFFSLFKNSRNDNMKAQKIDLMQTARQVKITNILNGSLAIVKDMYYKFNATVSGIDNNTDPWYHACNKCYMQVTAINSSATCTYYRTADIDYEERYRLKIDVTTKDQFLSITLFDAAKYYFGCDVKDYVLSTSKKFPIPQKEESDRKLIDRNFPNIETNMNVIAMEIHEVPKKIIADQTKVITPIKIQKSKRMKKLSDSEKMKEIATDIPHVEKDIPAIETDIESPQKTNRCMRIKKIKEAIADENPQKMRIHEVEKQNVPDESDDETPLIQLQRNRTRKTRQEKCHTNNPKFVAIKSTMTHNQHQANCKAHCQKVDKYILATQIIANLEDQHPRLKKQPKINWLFGALSQESEAGGVVAYNLSLSYLHVLEHEPPTFCCASRYIKLATTEAPTELYKMFVASTLDVLDKELSSARKGVYTFRAQGQIYHDLPSLVSCDNNPCYFQLYLFDTDNELTNKLSKFPQLPTLHCCKCLFGSTSVQHTLGYKHRVKHCFNCYDPLQYPFIFLRGEGGWHQGIRKQSKRLPHRRSSHSPTITNDIPTFVLADAIFANKYQDVLHETKGNVSCREYYCYKYNYEKHRGNPREGERYYERLLLNHVRGPLSFNDLLTINGKQCQTFKEAEEERGLLEFDNNISECLRQGVISEVCLLQFWVIITQRILENSGILIMRICLRNSTGYVATHTILYYSLP